MGTGFLFGGMKITVVNGLKATGLFTFKIARMLLCILCAFYHHLKS